MVSFKAQLEHLCVHLYLYHHQYHHYHYHHFHYKLKPYSHLKRVFR